jgi:hypothetical protein
MKKWSPTHLQPVGVPFCQRSENHTRCRDKTDLGGFGGFSLWTVDWDWEPGGRPRGWGCTKSQLSTASCSRVLLRSA